jgi:hypothetical protein
VGAVIDALMNAAAVAITAKNSKPNLEYKDSVWGKLQTSNIRNST